MTIHSIKIDNLLSFESLEIKDMKDINCIVGRNNVGKSNLLKVIQFFYNKLEEKEQLPPKLYSNYSYKGCISITFDTTRIFRISRRNPKNSYFSFIIRKLIPLHKRGLFLFHKYDDDRTTFTLSLKVYNDGSVKWSTEDRQTRNLILYLYPFFHIEPRHMDLHEWDSLWDLIARLKSFNLSKIDNDLVINFFDEVINAKGENSYSNYIEDLNATLSTKKSTQKEKVLSYIKAGLNGYKFEINEKELNSQSDGTNSFHFIKIFLKVLITVSRKEYITPFVFIDEPEIGLHPKMNEVLINNIYSYYGYREGKVDKVTRPKLFITTHSPNIVKEIIKKFRDKQLVLCFQKDNISSTSIHKLNSTYDSESFINVFSDNEARLFFSSFILFVEGETELEIFGNLKLSDHFPHLRNIDIYKSSSNVIGERINPSYSNSTIPYMFLFDADKAWTLEGNPRKFTLKLKKNGNYFSLRKEDLENDYNKYKLGFNKKHRVIKSHIALLISSIGKELDVDLSRQKFKNEAEFNEIFSSLQEYLLLKNCYINRTTFEGCLIQESSAPIFYKWISSEYSIDMELILNKVISSPVLTESMLIDYVRVLFNGKTKILTDIKSFNLSEYNKIIENKIKLNELNSDIEKLFSDKTKMVSELKPFNLENYIKIINSKSKLDNKLLKTSKSAKMAMHILEKKHCKK
ncbi:retron Eco8 family effector endonuclease [Pseudoalteromonas sp. Z9A5]|uniref:retron Eco8 family effector endonuclease n=1 Tax=Pseudoalteromonas sp. Z9A5 TaxID=2686355 RepID=UPI00140BFE35|nr:retron Eco8 family effector endonuclease [Pseudoalteromonas sp. Z9A5]